jgi:hypothetical protein
MGRLALIALLMLTACGSHMGSGTAAGTGTPASSPRLESQSPTPEQALPAGVDAWNAYESRDYGYSLRYPSTWFSLGNLGAPTTEAYFSNHKDAGSPMNLGADGVFLVLSADCQYWLGPNVTLVSDATLAIGSLQVVRYVVSAKSPDGNFYAADTAVFANSSCYRLSMLAWSLPVVQANLSDYDLMLTSLRFSARSAPIASPHPTTPPTQPT